MGGHMKKRNTNLDEKLRILEQKLDKDPENLQAIIEYVGLLHRLRRRASPRYEALGSSEYAFSLDAGPYGSEILVEVDKITGIHWDGDEFAFAKVEGNNCYDKESKQKMTYWLFRENWWKEDYRGFKQNPYRYDSSCYDRLGVPSDVTEEVEAPYGGEPTTRHLPIWNSDYYLINGKDIFDNDYRTVINWWTINQLLWWEQSAFINDFVEKYELYMDERTRHGLMNITPEERVQLWMEAQKDPNPEKSVSPNQLTINTLTNLWMINPWLQQETTFQGWENYVTEQYSDYLLQIIGSHASKVSMLTNEQGAAYGFFNADNIDLAQKQWAVCHYNPSDWVDEAWLGPFKEREIAETWYHEMKNVSDYGNDPAIYYQLGQEISKFKNPLLEFQILSRFAHLEEGYWLQRLNITGCSQSLMADLTFEPMLVFAQLPGMYEEGAEGEIFVGQS